MASALAALGLGGFVVGTSELVTAYALGIAVGVGWVGLSQHKHLVRRS
jgi:hypothetical protein